MVAPLHVDADERSVAHPGYLDRDALAGAGGSPHDCDGDRVVERGAQSLSRSFVVVGTNGCMLVSSRLAPSAMEMGLDDRSSSSWRGVNTPRGVGVHAVGGVQQRQAVLNELRPRREAAR